MTWLCLVNVWVPFGPTAVRRISTTACLLGWGGGGVRTFAERKGKEGTVLHGMAEAKPIKPCMGVHREKQPPHINYFASRQHTK